MLQHSLGRAPINDANASAIATLNGYDKSDRRPTCPPGMMLERERCEAKPTAAGNCPFPANRAGEICVATPSFPPSAKLLVANALMLARADVAKDYKALLKDRYAAEVFERASLDTVNGWVKQRTEGKIEKILEKLSDVVLVNAVYFKSRWAVVFDKKLTKNEFFSLTRSRQEMVPTMLQRANHAVVSREGYRAIRLPYAVRSLAMVIALPNEVDGLGDVARRLDADELAQMLAALRKRAAAAGEPDAAALQGGICGRSQGRIPETWHDASVRRQPRPTSQGLTGVPPKSAPTSIDQIVHKAVIEVSEESTEAAAATAIGVRSPAPRRSRSSRCSSASTGRSSITWSTMRPARCCSRAASSIRGRYRGSMHIRASLGAREHPRQIQIGTFVTPLRGTRPAPPTRPCPGSHARRRSADTRRRA